MRVVSYGALLYERRFLKKMTPQDYQEVETALSEVQKEVLRIMHKLHEFDIHEDHAESLRTVARIISKVSYAVGEEVQ